MKRDLNPLEITEMLLRMPKPYTSGLIVNRPSNHSSHAFRLFQVRMWREYAIDWNRDQLNLRYLWVKHILKTSKEKCIRIARVNLYLAKRLRREKDQTP